MGSCDFGISILDTTIYFVKFEIGQSNVTDKWSRGYYGTLCKLIIWLIIRK